MITRKSVHQIQSIQLHDYISIPSEIHPYSLGIEYMRNWFLEQFDDGYFKTVYVNGKHIFDDYRRFNRERLTKQPEMPALAIIPSVDMAYNRDNVDLQVGGRQVLNRRSRWFQNGLIQDPVNNIFLGMHTKLVQMNFTFRVRVTSRAQQIDLANYMKYAFRVGSTQGKNMSYDFHLPKEIMLNIAQSAGFELEFLNNEMKVKDIYSFLDYLNKHSMYPVLYKLRNINGNSEFFIRVPGMYTHITNTDELSIDDGERINQIDNRFHVEMNCILNIPAPQYYYYYSKDEIDKKFKENLNFAGLYKFKDRISPEKDEHGWRQYLSTEYIDDDLSIKTINFEELLENKDLKQVMNHTKSLFLSPSIFVNFKLFNNQQEIPIKINWDTFDILIDREQDFDINESELTIYVDLQYMNEQLIVLRSMSENRQN